MPSKLSPHRPPLHPQPHSAHLGKDSRGETELGIVGPGDDCVDVAVGEFGEDHDRTERFLGGDPHRIPDVSQNRRREKKTGSADATTAVE